MTSNCISLYGKWLQVITIWGILVSCLFVLYLIQFLWLLECLIMGRSSFQLSIIMQKEKKDTILWWNSGCIQTEATLGSSYTSAELPLLPPTSPPPFYVHPHTPYFCHLQSLVRESYALPPTPTTQRATEDKHITCFWCTHALLNALFLLLHWLPNNP